MAAAVACSISSECDRVASRSLALWRHLAEAERARSSSSSSASVSSPSMNGYRKSVVSGMSGALDGEAGVDEDEVAGRGGVDQGHVDALLAVGCAHEGFVAVDGDDLGRTAFVGAGDA